MRTRRATQNPPPLPPGALGPKGHGDPGRRTPPTALEYDQPAAQAGPTSWGEQPSTLPVSDLPGPSGYGSAAPAYNQGAYGTSSPAYGADQGGYGTSGPAYGADQGGYGNPYAASAPAYGTAMDPGYPAAGGYGYTAPSYGAPYGVGAVDPLGGAEGTFVSRDKLQRLRRRGRLPWALCLLMAAGLGALVKYGLDDRERLQREKKLAIDERAQADQRLDQAHATIEAQKATIASLQVKSEAQQTTNAANSKLIAALKNELTGDDGEVSGNDERITVDVVDRILFPSGEAELSLQGYRLLARVARVLKEHKDKQILVGGHTDDQPIKRAKFASNWELSAARAVNVARFLSEEGGIEAKRVGAAAYSQYRPRAKNRARNRRIEILLTPIVEVKKS